MDGPDESSSFLKAMNLNSVETASQELFDFLIKPNQPDKKRQLWTLIVLHTKLLVK